MKKGDLKKLKKFKLNKQESIEKQLQTIQELVGSSFDVKKIAEETKKELERIEGLSKSGLKEFKCVSGFSPIMCRITENNQIFLSNNIFEESRENYIPHQPIPCLLLCKKYLVRKNDKIVKFDTLSKTVAITELGVDISKEVEPFLEGSTIKQVLCVGCSLVFLTTTGKIIFKPSYYQYMEDLCAEFHVVNLLKNVPSRFQVLDVNTVVKLEQLRNSRFVVFFKNGKKSIYEFNNTGIALNSKITDNLQCIGYGTKGSVMHIQVSGRSITQLNKI